MLRLRRLDPSFDDPATNADLGLRAIGSQMESLEGNRLADPQAGRRQDLEQQAIAEAIGRHRQDERQL